MKKIFKLSILLLGALIVLLGCSQETKSEFVLQEIASKTKLTYVYDKEKDSVSKLTMEIIYDITKMNGTQKPFVVSETRLYRRWKELKVLHTLRRTIITTLS